MNILLTIDIVVARLRPGQQGLDFPTEIFLFDSASSRALGPTQSPILWVLGASFSEQSGRGVKLITYFHRMPRFRVLGATIRA
jgi:hypothetical protein